MSEYELTNVAPSNVLGFKREDIARSLRGVRKLIRKFRNEKNQSFDPKFIAVRTEKLRRLEIIAEELRELKDIL